MKKKKKKLQKLSYKLQFIITGRFRASSLSNLVKNPFEQIHKTEYKYGSDIKSEMCGIKYKDYKSCLEYKNTKELKTNLIEWKCFYCNKNYQNKFDDPHYPKKFCSLVHWKPFKNYEKCFLFYLKSSFRSQDIYVFVMTF